MLALSSLSALMLISGQAVAESYQSISSVNLSKTDHESVSTDTASINTTYYLSKKSSIGPLDQFKYINNISNVYASYSHIDVDSNNRDFTNDRYAIGGNYFINNFLVGAGYQLIDFDGGDDEIISAQLGYLFNKNFLVRAKVIDQNDDTEYVFSASYNHQLNESDYLGITISGDNDLDYNSIAAKYFRKLDQGRYFISELKYQDGKHNNYWAANVSYYFDDKTSVSAMYDDNDNYRVGVKHFFNNNVALSAGYGANTDESDYDVVDVNLTLQF